VPPFNEVHNEIGLDQALNHRDAPQIATTIVNSEQIHDLFAAKNCQEEWLDFVRTGRSNGLGTMQYALLTIPPNSTFPLHAHPNIEFIAVCHGNLYEQRLQGRPSTRDFSRQANIFPMNLNHLTIDNFQSLLHPTGSLLVNEIGSIHLSFTKDDGCVLFVLWSGGHANVPTESLPRFMQNQ